MTPAKQRIRLRPAPSVTDGLATYQRRYLTCPTCGHHKALLTLINMCWRCERCQAAGAIAPWAAHYVRA